MPSPSMSSPSPPSCARCASSRLRTSLHPATSSSTASPTARSRSALEWYRVALHQGGHGR
eukprot:2129988-Pyramimonas_sp.AAC.1